MIQFEHTHVHKGCSTLKLTCGGIRNMSGRFHITVAAAHLPNIKVHEFHSIEVWSFSWMQEWLTGMRIWLTAIYFAWSIDSSLRLKNFQCYSSTHHPLKCYTGLFACRLKHCSSTYQLSTPVSSLSCTWSPSGCQGKDWGAAYRPSMSSLSLVLFWDGWNWGLIFTMEHSPMILFI